MILSKERVMFKVTIGYKLRLIYAECQKRTQIHCAFHCKRSEQAGCVAFEYNKAENTCRLSKEWLVKNDENNDPDIQVYQGECGVYLFVNLNYYNKFI